MIRLLKHSTVVLRHIFKLKIYRDSLRATSLFSNPELLVRCFVSDSMNLKFLRCLEILNKILQPG